MAIRKIGKRYGGPWYSQCHDRILFESGIHEHFPGISAINKRKGKKKWREYKFRIEVPTYGTRNITIKFYPNKYGTPKVTTDGPSDSPHRYDDDSLCMWYPWDPRERRWIFEDGLLHLLVLIQAHLFREAWWRDNDEWLGPEIPHEQTTDPTECHTGY